MDRFAAAARDGFAGVEYLFPYAYTAKDLAQALQLNGLQQVLFNAPPGDWAAGERGLACLPGREAEFREGVQLALDYARVLACPRIHVMAGLLPHDLSVAMAQSTYVANLRWAAELAQAHDVDLLIEPINPRDMPGYFLNRQAQAHELLVAIDSPRVKVQFDLYHCQVSEGDLASKIRQYLPGGRVGHFQIAGVPQRHEPDLGEVNYPYLFALIDELAAQCGWRGWIGCEYRPAQGTRAGGTSGGLGWLAPYLPQR